MSRKNVHLIGMTGTKKVEVKIINAKESPITGIEVRVRELESGNEYWTDLDRIELEE